MYLSLIQLGGQELCALVKALPGLPSLLQLTQIQPLASPLRRGKLHATLEQLRDRGWWLDNAPDDAPTTQKRTTPLLTLMARSGSPIFSNSSPNASRILVSFGAESSARS